MPSLDPRSLAKVYEDATDPILLEDLEGRVISANPAAVRVYGWSEDDLRGKSIKRIVPADRHRQADDLLTRCKGGEAVVDVEGVRCKRDGTRIDSLLTLSLLRDGEGKPFAIVSVAKGITPLKRAQAELESTVAQRTAALAKSNARLSFELRMAQELVAQTTKHDDLVLLGDSIAVRGLRDAIRRYGPVEEPVQLTGPISAGLATVARAVHRASPRAEERFLHVDCAHLAQASLFDPDGKAELAAGGTLYLESVDCLTHDLQLELIQHLTVVPQRVDVRLLVSAARDLGKLVRDEQFDAGLADLLGRSVLRVPPLAERRDDLVALANGYVRQRARTLGKCVETLDEASEQQLLRRSWPGNLNELWSVLDRAIELAQAGDLQLTSLLAGGQRVGGYSLMRRLGKGGMGEVWLAKHDLLLRPAAIKLITPDDERSPEKFARFEARFRREVEATVRLRSPHTIQIYDFGRTEQGGVYYVMEALEGYDLSQLVKRFGPVSPGRMVRLMAQVCLSLGEAHQAGMVHRDVKPSNLFVCQLGPHADFVKVLDFGLVHSIHDPVKLTRTGFAPGTPVTMAPERLAGADADARSDLYAVGCVAYWLLTGSHVFHADDRSQLLHKHRQEPPEPPSSRLGKDLPKEVDELVLALLEKEPGRRPGGAFELRERLLALPVEAWTAEAARAWWDERPPRQIHGDPSSDAGTEQRETLPPTSSTPLVSDSQDASTEPAF
jgi:PAS domain S-box-containing protein